MADIPICDAHMHCWDQLEKVGKFNNPILGDCGTYLPEDYVQDLPGVKLRGSVHVEAFPTDQVYETQWIQSLKSEQFPLVAIVANANISLQKENERSTSTQAEGMEALEDVLRRHRETAPGLLRGIRWVLNHNPNWPQVHRGDYFTDPQFRAGFAKLEEHGLSYDLQLNPHQMLDAANFFKDFPKVPICLNHVGSLLLKGTPEEEAASRAVWVEGMKALAALPQVSVKLSMLSYCVADWWTSEAGIEKAKGIVMEVIQTFGHERCMFASNFPAEPAECRKELYQHFKRWVADLPVEVQEGLFYKNCEAFYRV